MIDPAHISKPLLAVANPIESTLVTSSYVIVPAQDIFPLTSKSPVTTDSQYPHNINILPLLYATRPPPQYITYVI